MAVQNAPCLAIGVGIRGGGAGAARGSAVPCGPGRGINSRARLARTGIVQSYLQTTLALLFIEPALFLPAVTSERRRATETVG